MNQKKFRVTFRIRFFLLAFSFLFLLIISVLLFIIPYALYTQLYISQAEYYCNNFLAQANVGVESALEEFNLKIQEVMDDEDILTMLAHKEPQSDCQYQYQTAVAKYFQPKTLDEYYLQELDLYIKDTGESVYYGTKPTTLSDPFNSIYYERALAYPTRVNWLRYNPENDCLELSALVYNKENYQVTGLMIVRLSTDFLMYSFNVYNTLDIDRLYIADQNEQILCTTESGFLGCSLKDLELEPDIGVQRTDTGIAILRPLSRINTNFPYGEWKSVILLDRQTLLKPFHQIAWVFYGIALCLLGISIFLILRFSSFITKPITALVSAMKEVEKEQLDITLPETSPLREMSEINQGFNKMVSRLDMLINSVYKSRLARQEAQLKSLQSQINPHFLFNTLQLISWKAYEYEATPVCDMLGSLSYMLETDLYSDDKNTFTLAEEVEYIRQYSKIIRCKYNDKIRIILDIPEELLDSRIPKLILQPFLENSITHGLAPKPSPGQVCLSVRREGPDLNITIQDDGTGIRSGILQTIKQPSASQGGHHIALNNIQDRIHLLYGNAYGFTIESQLNEGTTIYLKIPYIKEGNEDDKNITGRR